MSITLKVDRVTNSIKRIQRKLNAIPQEAYKVFRDNTPVRTGNAKRKTTLQGNVINANYEYAQVLDKGRHMTTRGMRGSDQAPEGMTKPTEQFIKNRISQILRAK